MRTVASLVMAGLLFGSTYSGAYEVATHRKLSNDAASQSILGVDQQVLYQLGLRRPIDSNEPDQTFLGCFRARKSILDLIVDGSVCEDDFPPGPIYHFFDPRTNVPLHLDPADYPGHEVAVAFMNSIARTSPDWAVLGQGSAPPFSSHDYSFPKARDYLYGALTSPIPVDRRRQFGLLFDSVGRMIHHIEDMAQPQHVRNDNHLSHEIADSVCRTDVLELCQVYRALRRESAYENWTNGPRILPSLPVTGYAPVYPGSGDPPDGLAVFTTPQQFWANAGKGMAEYTNRNFFSAGTMTENPPFTDTPFDVDVLTLCVGANPPCGRLPPADVYVTFFPSHVDDQFRPGSGPSLHPYAASTSIFDPEFKTYTAQRLPSVNRFTFAKDYEFLIPRAVGYSAGLINYFFRGNMEISLPDEGVYSVVDHSPSGCSAPCGFRTLKLKLKNVTPGNEAMGTGSIVAVAKYHINTCYRPDLSGEDGGTNFFGNSCRSPDESISVSAPVTVPGVRSDQPQQIPFNFTANPIPINASDVFLQVVFRGQLGQETDAVAVATKDISEPTFYGLENTTDYVFDDLGDQQYHPLPYHLNTNKLKVTDIRIAFGSNAATNLTIASLDLLDGGEHAHLALLTDREMQSDSISWGGVFARSADVVDFEPGLFTQDDAGPAAGIYQRNCDLARYRGLYKERGSVFINLAAGTGGSHILSSDTRPLTGTRQFASVDTHRVQPLADRSPRCSHPPPTGMNDLSTMAPFSPATAKAWTIQF
jgi:hypothetical protein